MNGDTHREDCEHSTANVATDKQEVPTRIEQGKGNNAEEQTKNERRPDKIQRWSLLVQWLTFFVVSGALVVYGLQWNEMKKANDAAHRANRLAQKSARAAFRSAMEASRANRLETKSRAPDVYVASFEVDRLTGDSIVTFLNRGQSLARAVRNSLGAELNPVLAETNPCQKRRIGPPTGAEQAQRLRREIEDLIRIAPDTPSAKDEVARLREVLRQTPKSGPLVNPVGEIPPGSTLHIRTKLGFTPPDNVVVFYNGSFVYEDQAGVKSYGYYCFRYANGEARPIFDSEPAEVEISQ